MPTGGLEEQKNPARRGVQKLDKYFIRKKENVNPLRFFFMKIF